MRSRLQTQGLALVAVLWLVAALSIMVTGLIRNLRGEIHIATHQRQSVVAGALADAAIRLWLQEAASRKLSVDRPMASFVNVFGQSVKVVAQPLSGLIDINHAPEPLLAALYQHGGGLSADMAAQLAHATVETRTRPDAQGRPEGFDAPEDLLRVPGVSYPLYATIARLVSANLSGGGRVNAQSAPLPVLAVLAQGNLARASQLAAVRETPSPLPMDTSSLNPAFIDNGPSMAVQVSAEVPLSDGASWVRTWTVSLMPSLRTGLPWTVLDMQQFSQPVGNF
ncbi:type II secretion system protein GspK [Hydrogenophaga soli]